MKTRTNFHSPWVPLQAVTVLPPDCGDEKTDLEKLLVAHITWSLSIVVLSVRPTNLPPNLGEKSKPVPVLLLNLSPHTLRWQKTANWRCGRTGDQYTQTRARPLACSWGQLQFYNPGPRTGLSAGESGCTLSWTPQERRLIQYMKKSVLLASWGDGGISAGVKAYREGRPVLLQ